MTEHDADDQPLKVYLVNPPIQDPWRTQGDYRREQRRSTIQFWIAIGSMVVALAGVVATAAIAIDMIRSTG